MKKKISVITAAVLAAGAFGVMTASASCDKVLDYTKENFTYVYFKAETNDKVTLLHDDFVYINKNDLDNSDTLLNSEIYLYTSIFKDRLYKIILNWEDPSKTLELINGKSAYDKYGNSPFTEYNNPESGIPERHEDDLNKENYLYSIILSSSSLTKPITLTSENTDDYPIACFDIKIPFDVPEGTYYIGPDTIDSVSDYITTMSGGCVEVIQEVPTNITGTECYSMYEVSAPMQINISDRRLGDIDKNTIVDDNDAHKMLYNYACANNDYEIPDSLLAASDVNGDRVVDDIDAEIVMDYALLYGNEEQPEVSFEDYVKDRIAEKAE